MVEHWYSVVHVADYRCATIIQIHHLTVKFLNVSHYIRNFKEKFSTGSKKRSLYWLGYLGANYQRFLKAFLHIPPEKTFTFAPCTEEFTFKWSRWETLFVHSCFQMVAGETKLFMRASSAIFQNVSSSGSRRDLRFGECPQKKSLPVVADEKGIFRIISRKNSKKIILPKLDRIFKINFPTTCRE